MSTLWYNKPANEWHEALPIGNGKLGAMIHGGVFIEHLQLNEDSIWYGGPQDRINPYAKQNLSKVRELIFNDHIPEAEGLLRYTFSGTPQSQRPYQSLGDLRISMKHKEDFYEDYRRKLCLDCGMAYSSYKIDDTHYFREYFASYPNQTIAIRLSASKERSLSFDIILTRERFYNKVETIEDDMLMLVGDLGKEGSDFALGCKVEVRGGHSQIIGEHVVVRDADEAIIYLAATSTFYQPKVKKYILELFQGITEKGYINLKQEHLQDYQSLYNKMQLTLENDPILDRLPTNERLARIKQGKDDAGLLNTYFNYSKYLLIASSRKGSLPANLQGIWNNEMKPNWDSKFTININTQMNYWMAEACQLSECHEPLFDLLERMVETGKKTAKEMYGCRGFVAHHNTDIWADTAPQDIYIPATYWVMGGAWLCMHLWTHYEYTQDKKWLEKMYYVLKEAVLFFLDFLVERGDYLVTCPSVSPENTYILPKGTKGCVCIGATMDNEILRDLFDAYIKAVNILEKEKDKDLAEKAMLCIKKLPPLKIGKHGQIVEWLEDYEEEEPGHRHISQLYALHPSSQIMVDETPDLAEAARKTLERRLEWGGGHTGWSCAWIVNFYARLWDDTNAYEMLKKLLTQSTFPNLFCNHPRPTGQVFQIDGNFGGANGILELLVQSNASRTVLLPACPKVLENGRLKGVKISGGATFDIEWHNGKLTQAKVYGLPNETVQLKLCYNKKKIKVKLRPKEEKDIISLLLEA